MARILKDLFILVYHAIYLEEMAASEVTRKLASVFNIPLHQINQVYRQGPTGIHIIVSDQVNLFFSFVYSVVLNDISDNSDAE